MRSSRHNFLKFSLSYAFRNMRRHIRRTSITVTTVTFAVAAGIIADRYASSVLTLWVKGATETGTAHAQLHAKGYWEKSEGLDEQLTLLMGSDTESLIRNHSSVETPVRRLEIEGMISTGEQSRYFVGKGVEPDEEMVVSPGLFTKNDEGLWPSNNDPSGITVGKGLADSMKLKIGDEVTLISSTLAGSVNGIDARVVGIVDAPIPSFSRRSIYTPLSLMQRLVRMPGRYTGLAIRLRDVTQLEGWVGELQAKLDRTKFDLRGWWDIEPMIRKVGRIFDSVVVLIGGLLFFSAGLSVLSIIFMMVSERTVEIGTLMAIGARPRDVWFLFALESAVLGLIGGFIGGCLGTLSVALMGLWGLPFQNPFGGGSLVIHPSVHWGVSLTFGLAAVFLCVIASLGPARRASRVDPVRAFRGQLN
jgi:putative ABC transport system permease protein